jgi:hypothetical protein
MERDRSLVPATGDSNRERSPSGDGDTRMTNIVVIVHIRIHDLDRPERCCARLIRPTYATTT